MACMRMKFSKSSSLATRWTTRAAIGKALIPAAPISGLNFPPLMTFISLPNISPVAVSKGDHVVWTRDLYGGAWRIFTKLWARFGVEFTFVDTTDPANVAAALRAETKLLWLETLSNPLLTITDIAACTVAVRGRGIVTVVDNTFATPCLQRPLELGADVVLHSTTKYINGHSDALGGVVITDRDDLHERLRFFQNAVGAVPGPQDCFLIARGAKTLGLRVERHCDSAEAIANYLDGLDGVGRVHFPGLAAHPSHEIPRKQMKRFGAVLAIELDLEGTRRFARALRLWTVAESLGGVKSLVSHPAMVTHASVEPEVRREVGIGDSLLRLSVGLEDPRDLIADLEQALAAARVGALLKEVNA